MTVLVLQSRHTRAQNGHRTPVKATLPSPVASPRPRPPASDRRRRASSLILPAAPNSWLYFHLGPRAGRRPTTERTPRTAKARGPEAHSSGPPRSPSPFRRAPPPPEPPARDPHPARDGLRVPAGTALPRPSRLGPGALVPPRPPLTFGCRLAAVRGGNFHSPLPSGSEFTTHFPTPFRGEGRASFSGSGGAGRISVTQQPIVSRQSGPPLAA